MSESRSSTVALTVAPSFDVARPPALGAGHHAAANAIADVGDREERAAGVGHAHLVARRDAPRRGIVGMDQQRRHARRAAAARGTFAKIEFRK